MMSSWYEPMDTPRDPLIRDVCPGCEPEADSRYALIQWCAHHRPTDAGAESLGDWYAHGTTEVDGECNKAVGHKDQFESMPQVEMVTPISKPYKLVSREKWETSVLALAQLSEPP